MRLLEHVLFGKYRLLKKLGTGRSGTVFLAYHTELEEYRAIKIVPRSLADHEIFRREALLLKTLHHPGIPIVYDIEEDEENSYLIEEYLEGESLYALVKRLGSLSIQTATDIGIRVCRIIQFMNSVKDPILYLDLQPRNLLVCGDNVRIIDFDHARYASDASSFAERYGTTGFAAPEQYCSEPMDCRTDVYAIGALIWFMCTGNPPDENAFDLETGDRSWPAMRHILLAALSAKKEDRYQSAGDLGDALEEFRHSLSGTQGMTSRRIVFAGSRPGIGTTHASLAFTAFLVSRGYNALFEESHDSTAVRTLASNMGLKADAGGEYHIKNLSLRPYYPPSVRLENRFYPIVVSDAGAFGNAGFDIPKADLYVLLCTGKWWETKEPLKAARILSDSGKDAAGCVLLFNHMSQRFKVRLPDDLKDLDIIYLPHFPDPFKPGNDGEDCFCRLLSIGAKRGVLCGFEKKPGKFLRRK